MSDFRKGLIVGMLITIGCGVFVGNKSNDDFGRYTLFKGESSIYMLDTKDGDFYSVRNEPNDEDKHIWNKVRSVK